MRALVALLLSTSTAHAVVLGDETALPCRPTIACTSDLVPPGTAELEVGYLYRKLAHGDHQQTIPVLAKLTLAKWVQLQVSGNGLTWQTTRPTFYADDVAVGFKFHLRDETRRAPSLSWSVQLSAPVSYADGFARSYDLFYIAYVTKDLGRIHADLNIGLNLYGLDGNVQVQPWIALALSTDVGHGLAPMIESYVYAPADPFATRDAGFLFALAYAPRKWIVFDAGGDVGFIWSQREVSAFVGMTIAPVNFYRRR